MPGLFVQTKTGKVELGKTWWIGAAHRWWDSNRCIGIDSCRSGMFIKVQSLQSRIQPLMIFVKSFWVRQLELRWIHGTRWIGAAYCLIDLNRAACGDSHSPIFRLDYFSCNLSIEICTWWISAVQRVWDAHKTCGDVFVACSLPKFNYSMHCKVYFKSGVDIPKVSLFCTRWIGAAHGLWDPNRCASGDQSHMAVNTSIQCIFFLLSGVALEAIEVGYPGYHIRIPYLLYFWLNKYMKLEHGGSAHHRVYESVSLFVFFWVVVECEMCERWIGKNYCANGW